MRKEITIPFGLFILLVFNSFLLMLTGIVGLMK